MNNECFLSKTADSTHTNYLMLAQAILFSDLDNGEPDVTCVYDTEEGYRLVAMFNTNKKCALFFNVTDTLVRKSIHEDYLLKGRYKAERFECGTETTWGEYYKVLCWENDRQYLKRYKRKRGYGDR